MKPKAKMNLHQCEYHLNAMEKSKNSEEFEINYAAFVVFGRTVTFVLQKEFAKNTTFEIWYNTKREEMKKNHICEFFRIQRNSIEKEGINALNFSLNVKKLQIPGDMIDQPQNSEICMSKKGIFYLIHKGTKEEDLIPAQVNGEMSVSVFFSFDGKISNVLELCRTYFLILKELVEDWTEIINKESLACI